MFFETLIHNRSTALHRPTKIQTEKYFVAKQMCELKKVNFKAIWFEVHTNLRPHLHHHSFSIALAFTKQPKEP